MDDFLIQLKQRLNMIACECDWNKDQIGLAFLNIGLNRITRLSTKPCRGADLRLPAETVRVGEAKTGHHSIDGRGHFSGIGISWKTVNGLFTMLMTVIGSDHLY